ncbi:hypothetical protein [Rhodococcus sp. RCBS9]|nr:hypothetical protein [Rhodococcus sp. RCBS9]WEX01662.1 hypothetical protein P0M12_18515 [Rhodococcus sp. RCBS9]
MENLNQVGLGSAVGVQNPCIVFGNHSAIAPAMGRHCPQNR